MSDRLTAKGVSMILEKNLLLQKMCNRFCPFALPKAQILGSEAFLFGLRLYVPVHNFSVMSGSYPGLNQY